MLGFNSDDAFGRNEVIGNLNLWGLDLEWQQQWRNWFLSFSHAYTRMTSFKLKNPNIFTFISAAGYGFGKDLFVWSNHLTKLDINYQVSDNWSINSGLQIYWGFPGTKYYFEYEDTNRLSSGLPRLMDESHNEVYGKSIHWQLGATYKINKSMEIVLNGHNLFGLIDKKYNKRNYLNEGVIYRIQAPSISLTLNAQL